MASNILGFTVFVQSTERYRQTCSYYNVNLETSNMNSIRKILQSLTKIRGDKKPMTFEPIYFVSYDDINNLIQKEKRKKSDIIPRVKSSTSN